MVHFLQWIGWRENLNRKPMGIFQWKIWVLLVSFKTNPLISGSGLVIIENPQVQIEKSMDFPSNFPIKNMGVSENSAPLNPMVLLIIIPFLNGYFIGNINPTFSDKPICGSKIPRIATKTPAADCGSVDLAHRHRRAAAAAVFGAATWGNVQYVQYLL